MLVQIFLPGSSFLGHLCGIASGHIIVSYQRWRQSLDRQNLFIAGQGGATETLWGTSRNWFSSSGQNGRRHNTTPNQRAEDVGPRLNNNSQTQGFANELTSVQLEQQENRLRDAASELRRLRLLRFGYGDAQARSQQM